MKNHFDKYLNIKDLILQYRPRMILELGALYGESTKQILSLKTIYPFWMMTISTGKLEDACYDVRKAHEEKRDYSWKDGISYEVLPTLKDKIIELCTIDTEHSKETLGKELEALLPKLHNRCILVFHDTVSFPEIRETIMEFLEKNPDFNLLRETTESAGAIAIHRLLQIGYYT